MGSVSTASVAGGVGGRAGSLGRAGSQRRQRRQGCWHALVVVHPGNSADATFQKQLLFNRFHEAKRLNTRRRSVGAALV